VDSIEARLKKLMLAGLAGNAAAHRRLLEAAALRLRAYFARRLDGDANVEDLVQETLIAVHQKRESYDRRLPFTAWLHAIARYKLIDHFRRRGVRSHVPLDQAGEIVASDDLDSRLAAADVERLLEELPERHRQSIMLTRVEGYSVAEAASMTGQSPAGVKVSVHRGIRRLMARVRGGDDKD
jgi:RNA polymerase sigma-70 factor (ECF subfamily)